MRIVSFDGGGIRGVVTAIVLERLEAVRGLAGWLERADLFAGTSSGGLVALALARRIPVAEIRRLFEERGRKIFADSLFDDLVDLGKIVGADYDGKALAKEIRALFGETKLRDLRRRVVVPAFDLDNEDPDATRRRWKPKVFHNFPGGDSDGGEVVWKVGMRTAAAPTYFPAFEGFVDGGVFANNPAMVAVAQSQDPRIGHERAALDDVTLLSLGTGTSLCYVRGQRIDWGFAQWAKPLVELMLDGTMGIADYQCRQLLAGRYHRLEPTLPPDVRIPLDGVERIADLVAFAEAIDLGPTVEFLKERWL